MKKNEDIEKTILSDPQEKGVLHSEHASVVACFKMCAKVRGNV